MLDGRRQEEMDPASIMAAVGDHNVSIRKKKALLHVLYAVMP